MFPVKEIEFSTAEIDRLRELLSGEAKDIIILSHTNPDGDAVGSSLAWAQWLRDKGHHVLCVVPNKFPYFLDWMDGISDIAIFKEDHNGKVAERISGADIIFCLDFNMISRLEGLGEVVEANSKAKYVLIDHHLDAPELFDIKISYTNSSSTSYLVYKLIEALDSTGAISKRMGEWLYVGMMTDTGNFSFSYLTPGLFEAVADLVRKGVDLAEIHSKVYNSYSVSRLRLLGYTLNRVETLKAGDHGVAYMSLTESEMRRFQFQQGDSEGFVNIPLSSKDIVVAAMFVETRKFIRVSMRSHGDIDVSRFCKEYFNGGGHKNASGGKSFVPMDQTIGYFRKSIKEFFGESAPEPTE